MIGIIVVFPKKENAINIRNLLVRNGVNVTGVATTGAQAMHYADTVDEGIVVCGYRFQDMQYTDLRESLPDTFDMLLVASADKWMDGLPDGVVGLPLPIKVYDLVNTVEMIQQTQSRKRRKRRETIRKRDDSQRKIIDQAKALLIERNNMSEEEAHRYLQKNSMESGTNMLETAQMVLTIMNE